MLSKTDSPQVFAAQTAAFRGPSPYQGPERRAAPRVTTDYPAILRTPVRQWPVRIVDISGSGAKLAMQSPPRVGTQAFMQCDSYEIFCTVIWVSDCSCSVEFDRPASPELFAAVGGAPAVATQVIANPFKIPLGQKRSRSKD